MEDSSKLYAQAWKNKLAASFTNSTSLNSDKANALLKLVTFSAQHAMLWVPLALLSSNSDKSNRNDLNWMGSSLGAMG